MAINLRKITQGERGTLTFTWEFPENLSSPASISGATITATMTDEDGVTTAVSGTLTGTAATVCTWALSAGDSGTAGTFTVVFKAIVTGVTTYTLEATLEVIANPSVTGTQNDPLVSISAADAAWVTAASARVADGDDVATRDNDGTAGNLTVLDASGNAVDAGIEPGYWMQRTAVDIDETVTIPAGYQMIVGSDFEISGTLIQNGDLIVVPHDALEASNNLSDLDSAATARTNLGLGTAALAATGDFDAVGAASAVAGDLTTHAGLSITAHGGILPEDAGITAVSSGRDLASTDAGKILECTGTFTLNCPNGLDAGFQVALVNVGAGIITVSATTSLVAKGAAYTLANQYGMATLYHRGSNVWLLAGDLT